MSLPRSSSHQVWVPAVCPSSLCCEENYANAAGTTDLWCKTQCPNVRWLTTHWWNVAAPPTPSIIGRWSPKPPLTHATFICRNMQTEQTQQTIPWTNHVPLYIIPNRGISWYIPNFINLYWGWFCGIGGLLLGLHKPHYHHYHASLRVTCHRNLTCFSFHPASHLSQNRHRISWASQSANLRCHKSDIPGGQ